MKMQHKAGKPASGRRELDAGGHFSMSGRRGTVIQVLRGQLWITQEGDARDYVVPARTRFVSARGGVLVVSALADLTEVAIRHEPAMAAGWTDSRVQLDEGYVEAVQRAARHHAAKRFARLVSAIWTGLYRWWRRRLTAAEVRAGCSHC